MLWKKKVMTKWISYRILLPFLLNKFLPEDIHSYIYKRINFTSCHAMPYHSNAYSQSERYVQIDLNNCIQSYTWESVLLTQYIHIFLAFFLIFISAVSHHSFIRYEIQFKVDTFAQHLTYMFGLWCCEHNFTSSKC